MSVQLCITFPFATVVRLSALFLREPTQDEIDDGTAADADDWQPVDPATVTAKLLDPDGNVTIHAFEDSPADIVRLDVGDYYLDVVPTVAGLWTFRFESTGEGAAADEKTFKVATTAFP